MSNAAPLVTPRLGLNLDGGGRERAVGRGGGADDEVDVDGIDAGADERLMGRGDAEIGGQLVVAGDMALANARALDDPVVRRVDDLGHVGVGHYALRQMRADAANDRSNDCHEAPPLLLLAVRRIRGAVWAGPG